MQKEYITSDLGEAAYLQAIGFGLTDIDKGDSKHLKFVFGENAELVRLKAEDYVLDRPVRIKPKTFSESIRGMKRTLAQIKSINEQRV